MNYPYKYIRKLPEYIWKNTNECLCCNIDVSSWIWTQHLNKIHFVLTRYLCPWFPHSWFQQHINDSSNVSLMFLNVKMLCKHFKPEILCQVPVLRSFSVMSCDCDMQSLPTSHHTAFTVWLGNKHTPNEPISDLHSREPSQGMWTQPFLEIPKKQGICSEVCHKSEQKGFGMNDSKRHSGKKKPQSLQHNTNALHFWPDLVVTDWCMMQQPSYSSRKGKPIASQSWIRRGNS